MALHNYATRVCTSCRFYALTKEIFLKFELEIWIFFFCYIKENIENFH